MLTDGCDDPPLPEEGLLSRPAFWAAYLVRMWALDAPDGHLVSQWFGTDTTGADAAWELYLNDVCRFRMPFGDGHSAWVTSCELPTDWGTEYSVSHPDWDRPAHLAHITRYAAPRAGTHEDQQGPGLSWRELRHIADTPDPAAPGVHDPHARLLLLLPALGDATVPARAAEVIGAALVSAGVPAAEAVRAARFLLDRPIWEAAHWTVPARPAPGRWRRRRPRRPRAAAQGGERRAAGILQCDAPASPRFGAPVARGITREQGDRLARALGTGSA
ncbi:hypothetical protein ACFC1R_21325 [Kitasatospora sp. NPDC056138]|uniref:hypothetical protein n=1 Tax=Kitasatospora sp. NPDC056138 TaxID=3345724 RepID=UPI0035DDFF00